MDTVSLLTEDGWCPPENVILPPLPGIDMSMLEYVHSYSNMIKGGVSSMWVNQTSGEYQFLWSPMHRNGADVGFEQMAGWYFDQVPNLSPNFYDLGIYARSSCIA